MTKAELLTALANKFYRIEEATVRATYGTLKYYLIKVYDKIGDALRDQNIAFYVDNEGKINEAAFWSPSEPKPIPSTGFQQDLTVYITAKITAGAIKAAFIESLDIQNEKAVVKAVLDQAGTYVEKRLLVFKEAGVFYFKQIG